jgi:RND family efflux transporter MFP subunit
VAAAAAGLLLGGMGLAAGGQAAVDGKQPPVSNQPPISERAFGDDFPRFRLASEEERLGRYRGNTRPIEEGKLSLRVLGVVREIPVKEGQRIAKGTELLVQDDRAEQARLKLLEVEAKSSVKIDAAKTTQKNKEVELKRQIDLDKTNSTSKLELERAQLEYDLSGYEIQQAELEKQLKGLQAEEQKTAIDMMRVVSPISGIVMEMNIKEGEVVDPQKPAITVVNIDKLKVDVYLPMLPTIRMERELREKLKTDPNAVKELDVLFPEAEDKPVKGKIIYFSPVVDTGAARRKITLEVPNPDLLPAGMPVKVVLPEELRVAAKDR